MANEYDVGDRVKITATFAVDDVATDPTAVTIDVEDPSGNVTAVSPSHDGDGIYTAEVDVDEAGRWWYRAAGTGAATAAGQAHFDVAGRRVPAPA